MMLISFQPFNLKLADNHFRKSSMHLKKELKCVHKKCNVDYLHLTKRKHPLILML